MSIKTLVDYKKEFVKVLQDIYPPEELEFIYRIMLEDVFKNKYISISANRGIPIEPNKKELLERILVRLSTNEPIQHILGKAHFYDLEFNVNPSVLIPRQETELLVHHLIYVLKRKEPLHILDIGTGSGCIAMSLKKNLQASHVTAIDVSNEALQVARSNAQLNEVEVDFVQENILDVKKEFERPFDLIVSNPPYVRQSEKQLMHANVLDYDPGLALFVEDSDPLVFYEAITAFAELNLAAGGVLAFEINEAFGIETAKLIKEKAFINVEIMKDLNGKERIITALKK